MTSYESERALVYLAEQIIKTFGKDFGLEIQEPKQEPVEPLIKDEKIRKAVKAWAEANEETEIKVKGGCLVATFKGLHKQLELELNCTWTRDGVYSIAELCGEEDG